MSQNLIEDVREIAVKGCFELDAFKKGWLIWKTQINKILGTGYNEIDVLNLGDHLAAIFKTTGKAGRAQSSVAGGGYGWEGIVCWYLNLCLAGSRAVALRKSSDSPMVLRDAISVNYGNFKSNTESDITVIVFPNHADFTTDINQLNVTNSKGNPIPLFQKNKELNLVPILNRLTEIHFNSFEIGIVQCKTNWNDNAQIPMLWSMIYETSKFSNTSISVGSNGFSIDQLSKFSYSFCTVPTNGLKKYKPTAMPVNRVRNLTGGNYWGYPSQSGIASSIKEIFNFNFKNAFSLAGNIRSTIKNTISLKNSDFSYFDLP